MTRAAAERLSGGFGLCNVSGVPQVFPVSKKVHTTRCKAQGVVTCEDTQLVSVQTCHCPGAAGALAAAAGFWCLWLGSLRVAHGSGVSLAALRRQTYRICLSPFQIILDTPGLTNHHKAKRYQRRCGQGRGPGC